MPTFKVNHEYYLSFSVGLGDATVGLAVVRYAVGGVTGIGLAEGAVGVAFKILGVVVLGNALFLLGDVLGVAATGDARADDGVRGRHALEVRHVVFLLLLFLLVILLLLYFLVHTHPDLL